MKADIAGASPGQVPTKESGFADGAALHMGDAFPVTFDFPVDVAATVARCPAGFGAG
ncbi:hypothetical protein [Pelagibacterium halotolerans]|uniref:hypothetical protein n=1 Tax=Pelagibacterium halotolerans TaxID=531813 RepID=UPI003850A8E9